MPDQYGRTTIQDGLNFARGWTGVQNTIEARKDRKTARDRTKLVEDTRMNSFTIADQLRQNPNLEKGNYKDEDWYTGNQLYMKGEFDRISKETGDLQLSNAGRQAKLGEIQLNEKKGEHLRQLFHAERDPKKKLELASQWNNTVLYNGIFTETDDKGIKITNSQGQESYEDLSTPEAIQNALTTAETQINTYYAKTPKERLNASLTGEMLRIEGNKAALKETIENQTYHYRDSKGNIYYLFGAAPGKPIRDKKDGRPLKPFFARDPNAKEGIDPDSEEAKKLGLTPIKTSDTNLQRENLEESVTSKKQANKEAAATESTRTEIFETNLDTKKQYLKEVQDTESTRKAQGEANLELIQEKIKSLKKETTTKVNEKINKLDEQKRKKYKEDLALMLQPFAGSKVAFDEAGNLSITGKTALEDAMMLVDKYQGNQKAHDDLKQKRDAGVDEKELLRLEKKVESTKLTTAELKKIKHAFKAWEMYNGISKNITDQYLKEEQTSGTANVSWKDYK